MLKQRNQQVAPKWLSRASWLALVSLAQDVRKDPHQLDLVAHVQAGFQGKKARKRRNWGLDTLYTDYLTSVKVEVKVAGTTFSKHILMYHGIGGGMFDKQPQYRH